MMDLLKAMAVGVSIIVLMSLFVWAVASFAWFQLVVVLIIVLIGATGIGYMVMDSWRDHGYR